MNNQRGRSAARAALTRDRATSTRDEDPGVIDSWRRWHRLIAPRYTTADYADCHIDFNEWLWNVVDDPELPRSTIEAWARGLAKSTTAELGVAQLGSRNKRSYFVYVCRSQDLADDHVRNIANLCESNEMARHYPGMATRFVGKYGQSKGWRRDRISTASGFTVDALGLDTAARGIKLDEQRPDGFVLDDVDHHHDTRTGVDKKLKTLADGILMAGSTDVITMFVQNVIHDDSIVHRIMNNNAGGMLTGARIVGPIPALEPTPPDDDPDGDPAVVIEIDETGETPRHVVRQGRPVWAGFDIDAIEKTCDRAGLDSFLRESQHDVDRGADGLWHDVLIKRAINASPHVIEVAVGVDPPASKQGVCGIVCGTLVDYNAGTEPEDGEDYRPRYGIEIWHDRSIDGGAGVWPAVVAETLRDLEQATNVPGVVVPEINNGGDMVTTLIGHEDSSIVVDPVRAGKGQDKEQRAAPAVRVYKNQRVVHLEDMPELVKQMRTWRISRGYSPDRLDALVWLVTRWLPYLSGGPAQVFAGNQLVGDETTAAPTGSGTSGRIGLPPRRGGGTGRRLGVRDRR